jgi:hypothetical protein
MPFAFRAQVLIAWATAPFSGSPSWTDVTAYVRFEAGISMQRGRQDNISAISAGRLTLTVDNSGGEFTVGRSGSPWAPNVKIGRRIQVNVPDENGTLHTRFDGLITELPAAWEGPAGFVNLAAIQASDLLAWIARQPPLLSWTQQEMLADAPLALWSLTDTSNVTQAADQAGQGAAPLKVASQGDGTGQAAPGSGVPLTEIITSQMTAQQQATQTFTFSNPGSFSVTLPAGTLVSCRVQNWAAGTAGVSGTAGAGGAGGKGGEYAEEPNLQVTPGLTYTGSVGAPGAPSGGQGGDTTFTGDSVTVLAHGSGSGSTNTTHFSGGSGGANQVNNGGGAGGSGGPYQAGNNGLSGATSTGAGAVTGGGAGGAGDKTGAGAGAGSAPGGGGGGGFGSPVTAGGSGGAGQVIITYAYIPAVSSQQNSPVPSWLFTPSPTLAARVLSGPLPQPVTAAAGFAFECWAAYAGIPAASVTTVTTPGAITFTAPPGGTTADVACWAAGSAGTSAGGAGGKGGEYAEEPALAITPDSTYSGSVGAAGSPSGGQGGDTTFTGDSVTVLAHGSGSGSTNTTHFSGGSGGALSTNNGGGGGSSGGPYQAGNNGLAGNIGSAAGGAAVTGGGAGGQGDTAGAGPGPGSAPGGGGGGGHSSPNSSGASGAPGQMVITCQPGVSTLLTLVNPRGQTAIAVWVTTAGHLQLASTSGYGTRNPAWTTIDAGQTPAGPFHVVIDVAVTTGVATLRVNNVSAGTLTLPAGASYTWMTAGGAYGSWLGGWNGSAGLAAVYPAPLGATRTGVHYTAGTTGFAGTSTGNMIAKIAGYIGLPSFWYTAPAGSTDPSYGLSTVSYYDLNGQQPLAAMQAYETAEAGVLYVSAAGQLIFADRASRYAAGAAGSAFTLAAGQYGPDASFKSNDQYLCTAADYATVNLPGGYPVISTTAKPDFGYYTASAGTPSSPQAAPFADAAATAGTYSTDDIMDAGWWQAGVFGQATPRVPSLTVDLLTLPASELSTASFYGTDIGSAVQLPGLPSQAPDSAGQPLAAYHVIEGINETIGLDAHTAELYTSPLSQNAAWIPGDALLGVLGTTNTVGRSQTSAALGPPYITAGPGGTGTATSPAAFQIFLSIPVQPGIYTVSWSVTLSGTVGAPEASNFAVGLNSGGGVTTQSVNAAAAGTYKQATVVITATAADSIVIKSWSSAATAGAVYGATIATSTTAAVFGATLNRTGSAGAQDWRTLTVNTQNKLTPPLLIAQQASAQTLATAAGQPVAFDTLLADTAGGMGTTLTYTIPAGFAGWWWASAVVQAATGTANLGGLAAWFSVTLSGVNSHWHSRNLPYLSTAPYTAVGTSGKIGPFSPGDTIQVIAAWSGTAASVPLGTADGGSMLTLMWEGYT